MLNHSASTATNIKIRAVDPDPAFRVNSDPDPILIQGFDDQELKPKNTAENFIFYLFLIKNCNFLMSKLQETHSALKREHPSQKMKLITFSYVCWSFFALLDLDPNRDPGTPMNPDPIRIRIQSGSGSTTPIKISNLSIHLHLFLSFNKVAPHLLKD